MKKTQVIALTMILCIASIALALDLGVFNTKQEAKDTLKALKEDVGDLPNHITYTTDKICELDYVTENTTSCQICFNVTKGDELWNNMQRCINVREEANETEMDLNITQYVEKQIQEMINNLEIKYTERQTTGRKINIDLKDKVK